MPSEAAWHRQLLVRSRLALERIHVLRLAVDQAAATGHELVGVEASG